MVPCRTGNYMRKVSYGGETRWGHALPVISSEAKRSREISLRKVSYGGETWWCHVGQETICKQFPAVMKHDGAMSDRKLYANSFLPW